MADERRFQLGAKLADTDEPGLVLNDDGTVSLVDADGTRSDLGSGGGGGSLPAQWTVDPDTGQLVIGFTDTGGLNVAVEIDYEGDPTDYIPLLAIGHVTGTPDSKNVYTIDSSGDADHWFRDSGISLIYHRQHDGETKQLVKIGESTFSVSNTLVPQGSMVTADYDLDYLALGAPTSTLAFFGGAGAAKQTGVAVSAAGIHAALVAYGLIAA